MSFVRELWEPEGLPQPLQRGRVIANDQVYMGYANVGSVQIGGPYQGSSRPRKDTPSRRAIFVCQPRLAVGRDAPAPRQILSRMARLRVSAAGDEGRTCRRCSSSSTAAGRTAAALTPAFSSRSNACSSIRISCFASIATSLRQQPTRIA